MIIKGNKLYPADGYKYITDGTSFSDCVILGVNGKVDDWHDTNDEPPVDEEAERERREREEYERHRPPTDMERIEAQMLYTALMTDTLLEV